MAAKTPEEKAAEAAAKAEEAKSKRLEEVAAEEDPAKLQKVIDSDKEDAEVRIAAMKQLNTVNEVIEADRTDADDKSVEEINKATEDDLEKLREIVADEDYSPFVRLAASVKAAELAPDPVSPEDIADLKARAEAAEAGDGEKPEPEEAQDGWTYDPPLTPAYPLGAEYRWRDEDREGDSVKLQRFDNGTMDWEDDGVHEDEDDVIDLIAERRAG